MFGHHSPGHGPFRFSKIDSSGYISRSQYMFGKIKVLQNCVACPIVLCGYNKRLGSRSTVILMTFQSYTEHKENEADKFKIHTNS